MDWIFRTLSVIASRSSLVNDIKIRAAVRFHMPEIGVLGILLFLVRHVDQQIESVALGITLDNRKKLLLMKLQQFRYGCAEIVQKPPVFLASCTSRVIRL